jgi:ABC-2 type transport system ATP-binding protein
MADAAAVTALECRGLSVRFGARAALQDVTFAVHPGERVAVIGANGSGKSTLIGALAGLVPVFAGGVHTRGTVALVRQTPGLDALLTIRENLRFVARIYGLSFQAIPAVLERAGLTDRQHDRVGTLSGGLIRRADLARALLTRPDVLLLDEPTSGLDALARAEFARVLLEAQDLSASAVLWVTHSDEEALACGRVLALEAGRLGRDLPAAALPDIGSFRSVAVDGRSAGVMSTSESARVAAQAAASGQAVRIEPCSLLEALALDGESLR